MANQKNTIATLRKQMEAVDEANKELSTQVKSLDSKKKKYSEQVKEIESDAQTKELLDTRLTDDLKRLLDSAINTK